MPRLLVGTALLRGPDGTWAAALERLMAQRLKIKKPISVAFVSRREIKRLNTLYRRERRATDVLSFNLLEGRGFPHPTQPRRGSSHRHLPRSRTAASEQLLGEIVLCLPVVRKKAALHGNSVNRECMMLVIHGILHILGYDHERPRDAARMQPLESRLLTALEKMLAKK